jgi:sigma-E factor negative regulatory protein RseC
VIKQQGRVLEVLGSEAWVQVGGRSGCSACDAGRGCGAGVFAKLLDSRDARLRVENTLGCSPGEPVMLGLADRTYLALVARLYGLPLVAGLLAGVLAYVLAGSFGPVTGGRLDAVVGGAALLSGYLALRWARRDLSRSFTRFSPRMLESGPRLDCRASDRKN